MVILGIDLILALTFSFRGFEHDPFPNRQGGENLHLNFFDSGVTNNYLVWSETRQTLK
jgi:hypothetical protein